MDQHKLSLLAQYDDLVRLCESFIGGDLIEEKVRLLLENCEKQRILWLIERNELNQSKEIIKNLNKENHHLETVLKNFREAFKKEVNLKEKFKQERDSLFKKINLIQKFLLEDDGKENNTVVKEKILSSLNMTKTKTTIDKNLTENSSLFEGIEFDETTDDNLLDDNILNETIPKELSRKRRSLISNQSQSPTKKALSTVQPDNTLEKLENEDQFDENAADLGKFKSGTLIRSQINELSQTLVKQRLNFTQNTEFKVDNRQHQFFIKKSLKSEKCGICGQSITFMSTGYRCRDCRAICHMGCKEKVPLPCIPYVSRSNIGKQGKLVLISDFVQLNCRPCVPALIVHCCTEIEKRGLEEIGPYRIAGSMKDVVELKKRILNAKKGIPNICNIDIYVLCDVVKLFLRDLDESLITKLAWRDFITGASLADENERENYLCDLISNLHVANRDTLAYIILHLQKIAASPDCKMPKSNIAKVFGPTIVGFSMKDPPAEQMREENAKQIAVMEALLNIDTDYWKNLISNKTSVPLVRKDSINELIGNLNYGSHSSLKLENGYTNYSNSRMSIGSRLCGGRIGSGALTPLKTFNSRTNSNKTAAFKPLF